MNITLGICTNSKITDKFMTYIKLIESHISSIVSSHVQKKKKKHFYKKNNHFLMSLTCAWCFFRLSIGLSKDTGLNSFRSTTGLGPALDGVQTGGIPPSLSVFFPRSGLGCLGGGGGSLPGDQTPVGMTNRNRKSMFSIFFFFMILFILLFFFCKVEDLFFFFCLIKCIHQEENLVP